MTTRPQHEVAASVRTRAGREALPAILADPDGTLLALDFDGTIAPIADDPEQVRADPAAVAALARLGDRVGAVVVITGRPARTAVRLGGLRKHAGLKRLIVLGQYGAERWDASTDEVRAEPEPEAITAVAEELPDILDRFGLGEARIEHKGRAVGVHTRELDDPAGAYATLLPELSDLAGRHGLRLEPGRFVLEIRASSSDKGDALRDMVTELGARHMIFIGDDLGDLPAFDAVDQLREQGRSGLLICSASAEQDALAKLADVIVAGPEGVAQWLTRLADRLDGGRP